MRWIELAVGVVLCAFALFLASDYLFEPIRTVEASEAQTNILSIRLNGEFDSVDVISRLSPERETVAIQITPADDDGEHTAALSYEVNGFGDGDGWDCETFEVVPDSDAVVLREQEVIEPISCSRDSGLVELDRQGLAYLFPTEVVFYAEDYDDGTSTVPYSFHRSIITPQNWDYRHAETMATWSSTREATEEGTGFASYDVSSDTEIIRVPSDDAMPLQFVDEDRLRTAERHAWISAIIVGAGAGLVFTSAPGLVSGYMSRRRTRAGDAMQHDQNMDAAQTPASPASPVDEVRAPDVSLALLSQRYDIPLRRMKEVLQAAYPGLRRITGSLKLSDEQFAHVLASFPEETARPLKDVPTAELLSRYAAILRELRTREVVRTGNAPIGDYAEHLAQLVYGGTLATNSGKSYDLITPDGRRIQVKARLVARTGKGTTKFSAFRSFEFDVACFLLFDAHTYALLWAKELSPDDARRLANRSDHVNADHLTRAVVEREGRDVTSRFRDVIVSMQSGVSR